MKKYIKHKLGDLLRIVSSALFITAYKHPVSVYVKRTLEIT